MSETQPAPTAQPPLVVNAQYVKDLSFEVPNAPEVFSTLRAQPNVNINLDVQARRLNEGQDVFEVTLQIKAEATDAAPAANGGGTEANGKTVFIAELAFCGVFTLRACRRTRSSRCCWSSARACCSPTRATSSPMSRVTAASRPCCCSRSTSSPYGRAAAKGSRRRS